MRGEVGDRGHGQEGGFPGPQGVRCSPQDWVLSASARVALVVCLASTVPSYASVSFFLDEVFKEIASESACVLRRTLRKGPGGGAQVGDSGQTQATRPPSERLSPRKTALDQRNPYAF